MAGQPCACAAVGSPKVVSNHCRTGSEKTWVAICCPPYERMRHELSGSATPTARSRATPVTGRLPAVDYQSPEWHPAFEEYCETIFELREDDVDVIQARIAERLGVSRPAVSEMIKRMEHEGFVALSGTH